MTRPVAAEFTADDVMGRTYTVRLLGPDDVTAADVPSPCGVALPSDVVAITLPQDVVDPFASNLGPDGRTVWFDVSGTPLVMLAGVMGSAAMGSALTPPADHDDAGRRGD